MTHRRGRRRDPRYGSLLLIGAVMFSTVATVTSQPVTAAATVDLSVVPAHVLRTPAVGQITYPVPCHGVTQSHCSAVFTLTVSPTRQVLTPMGTRQTRTLRAEYDKSEFGAHQWHDELVVDVWWDGIASGADKFNATCKADGGWTCDNAQTGQGWYAPKAAYMNFSNRREDAGRMGGHDSHSYLRTYVRPSGSTWVEANCDCPNI
jgi:hypothetical protein